MTILVTGCKGQLGSEFRKIASYSSDYQWIFTDHDTLDISNENDVIKFFQTHSIGICINCAAYTAVDKAEDDYDKAHNINTIAVGILARCCKLHNTVLFHISTDYIFDGNNDTPYTETDIANPISVYGKTKVEGENVIKKSGCYYVIMRTSWLYSSTGNNFVKTMLRLAEDRRSVNVVNDQYGSPTWAFDLANTIMFIIGRNADKEIHEIFNYSNDGIISWYEFANAIFKISGKNCKAIPITTEEFGSKAARPKYSAFNKNKIKSYTGLSIPFWRDSLIKCIEELNRK